MILHNFNKETEKKLGRFFRSCESKIPKCNRRMVYCIYQLGERGDFCVKGKMWGNEYRTTVVCVDAYEDGVLSGRLYNPALTGGTQFRSVMDFLIKMEDLLDRMQLPQSFTAARSFAPAPRHRADSPPDQGPQEGKLGTFSIRVIFRQNASWQGSVTWLEGGRDESFRSVLELLLLMHSALEPEQD